MWRPPPRTAGTLSVVGGLCVLGAMIPLSVWSAPHPGDSYVFDPPMFSGVWAQRVVVPVLTFGANGCVLAGLYTLYWRDRPAMPRWQRGIAGVTLFGTIAWLFGTSLVTSAGPNDLIGGVVGGLVAVLALLVTVPGLTAWGAGYLRAGRIRLGAALAGAPVLTGLYVGVSLSGVDFDPVSGLLLAAPTAVMAVLVGYDLWVETTPSAATRRTES